MATHLPTTKVEVDYETQKQFVKNFLLEYETENGNGDEMVVASKKYLMMLQDVANRDRDEIAIELDDLYEFERQNKMNSAFMLVDYVSHNAAHYIELFSTAVDETMPDPSRNISYKDDVLDMILFQRRQRNMMLQGETPAGSAGEAPRQESDLFPPQLTRRYSLYIKPLSSGLRERVMPSDLPLAVRDVKSKHIGKLITVRGIVTRVSDVKPAVVVSAYTCDQCGNEVFQEVKSRQFSPIIECPSKECVENNSKGQLFPSTRASRFLPFQDVRIQEMADQVPVGQVPRTLTISVRGTLVRKMTPGDLVDVSGIFLPSPYTGLKALKAGLLTDTFLEAQYVHEHKQQYNALELTPEIEETIAGLRKQGDVYERLAMSIAPEIFGHSDVKKALLLLLVGGVTKEIGDGMRIRGDINICLMGDPGVAKSQLLKYITKIAPRGVYTTGRGSSGVGLTAAVMRDPVTEEMVLEGGALVLADNGVCCIDEFDKMDDSDRTAIHEVMEQQTISISKAGISTSLNARTSILAAANPVYGRYNPRLAPVHNINLPAALLSRFDLLFLLLDTPDPDVDTYLAQHVSYVHMMSDAPASVLNTVEPQTLRQYIAMARQFRPLFPREVAEYAAAEYVRMRRREQEAESQGDSSAHTNFGHVTPRALLGILRLAQAHARINFSHSVTREDVDEALRLNESSKMSLQQQRGRERDNPISTILQRVRDFLDANGGSAALGDVKDAIGVPVQYSIDRFNEFLNEYTTNIPVFYHARETDTLMWMNAT